MSKTIKVTNGGDIVYLRTADIGAIAAIANPDRPTLLAVSHSGSPIMTLIYAQIEDVQKDAADIAAAIEREDNASLLPTLHGGT